MIKINHQRIQKAQELMKAGKCCTITHSTMFFSGTTKDGLDISGTTKITPCCILKN